MSDWKNILRDAGYFSVGAAAVLWEAGGKAVKSLVRKGEETLRDNQDTVDELKRKAREFGGKVKDAAQKAAAKPNPDLNTSAMTPEERAELRRQLDEAGAACKAEAAPLAPDVIRRTEVHAEEEAPEITIKPEDAANG